MANSARSQLNSAALGEDTTLYLLCISNAPRGQRGAEGLPLIFTCTDWPNKTIHQVSACLVVLTASKSMSPPSKRSPTKTLGAAWSGLAQKRPHCRSHCTLAKPRRPVTRFPLQSGPRLARALETCQVLLASTGRGAYLHFFLEASKLYIEGRNSVFITMRLCNWPSVPVPAVTQGLTSPTWI